MDLNRHWALFTRERRANLERRDAAFSAFDGHYRQVVLRVCPLRGATLKAGAQVLGDILAAPGRAPPLSIVAECQKCGTYGAAWA
jgi:hypothetical protein